MLVVKAVSLDVKIVVEVDSLVITWSVFLLYGVFTKKCS